MASIVDGTVTEEDTQFYNAALGVLQIELKKNCKASLILLPKRKRRLQRRKNGNQQLEWHHWMILLLFLLTERSPLVHISSLRKNMLKWRLLGATKRRIYLSEYLWQEKATKMVAAQSMAKADKAKYLEVTKKTR